MFHRSIMFLSCIAASAPALAQHAHGHHGQPAAHSPYAGEQQRGIKALSAADEKALLEGAGMGYAKAAELNGYPGPMHTLGLADALGLSAEQRSRSRALMQAHKARARTLGARLVEAERALDSAFARRQIDEAGLRQHTAAIAAVQAELRAEHLATHLAQTALLTPAQIESYTRLRGYTDAAPLQRHAH